MIFVVLILFLLLCGCNYYLSNGIQKGLSYRFPNIKLRWFVGSIALLTGISVLTIAGMPAWVPEWLGYGLRVVGAYWLGAFLYLMLFAIVADGVRFLCRICKFPFARKGSFRFWVSMTSVALALLTVLYGGWNARQLRVVSYDVQIAGKTDISDMKIVMISDLHLGSVGSEERLSQIVEKINSCQPDLVCVAGDFFDTDFNTIRDPEQAAETLRGLKATYGVYTCLGNHDGGSTAAEMVAFLEKSNVHLLQDASVVIDGRLLLAGRLDASPIGGYEGISRKELEQILPMETEMPVIVLDHNPAQIDTYTNRADLVLSGHTHEGQLFPGSWITGLLYTVDYGYYQAPDSGTQIVVTSGIGTWGPPVRVGTNSEIVLLRVTS